MCASLYGHAFETLRVWPNDRDVPSVFRESSIKYSTLRLTIFGGCG